MSQRCIPHRHGAVVDWALTLMRIEVMFGRLLTTLLSSSLCLITDTMCSPCYWRYPPNDSLDDASSVYINGWHFLDAHLIALLMILRNLELDCLCLCACVYLYVYLSADTLLHCIFPIQSIVCMMHICDDTPTIHHIISSWFIHLFMICHGRSVHCLLWRHLIVCE